MERARDVGIIFADIVGSSRMYELLGDDRALAVVTQVFDTIAAVVARHDGRIVKTIGDAMMTSYDTPAATLSAAIEMRRRVGALPPVPDVAVTLRPRVRVGAHFGAAVPEGGDWFGDTVNIAARLSNLASAGQVLTTADLLERLPPALRSLGTVFAEIEVKGRDAPVRMARVADDTEVAESTQVSFRPAAAAPAEAPRIALQFGAQAVPLSPGQRRILCGREAECDVVLRGALASRRHATIEIRRDKVVLIDHSTNGTWLVRDDHRPMRLMREEFGLTGQGRIHFGDPASGLSEALAYSVG